MKMENVVYVEKFFLGTSLFNCFNGFGLPKKFPEISLVSACYSDSRLLLEDPFFIGPFQQNVEEHATMGVSILSQQVLISLRRRIMPASQL